MKRLIVHQIGVKKVSACGYKSCSSVIKVKQNNKYLKR